MSSDVETLALRLRQLADEIESAHRFGVPIPFCVTVNGHTHGGASFSATPEEFDAWADYCEGSTTEEYDHDGKHWLSAVVDVNGLPLSFATTNGPAAEAEATS